MTCAAFIAGAGVAIGAAQAQSPAEASKEGLPPECSRCGAPTQRDQDRCAYCGAATIVSHAHQKQLR